MGEWSKKIGEFGEKIIDDFFKQIGWADAQKGVSITCNKPEKHKLSGEERNTHGIDKLFSYESKLIDEQLEIILVSVKYTTKKYKKNPNSEFKNHFRDLAQTIECFKLSQERQNINNSASGVSQTKDIGVLFWLSNHRESDDDVISKVANVSLTDDFDYDSIYLVDNNRAAFIYYSIQYAQRKFNNCDINFYYQDTGKNFNPVKKTNCGKILPVQFINSSILPFRIEKKELNEVSLLITAIEDFDKDDLKRLMGLAQQVTQNWAGKIYIAFPDYDELLHGNIVKEVKMSLQDKNFTQRIEVTSFIDDFRNANN